jgi:16S rRNA (guanine(966)-N(2))-methyltransferase RsmD
MRVISGDHRGRRLKTLTGEHTRPTSEKVKEAMFSILQFDLEGRRVLDLFAGSGQLGIEALSRGARECVFVENDRKALGVVAENIEKCKLEESAKPVFSDYASYLKRGGEKFDIILIDPPYSSDYAKKSLNLISKFDTLNINGIIVVESEADFVFDEVPGLAMRKEYIYGRTKLTLFLKA